MRNEAGLAENGLDDMGPNLIEYFRKSGRDASGANWARIP